ncbi:unknown [Clostridium sp. CAG:352]|nr:unknown [Clostridium sp. CAG:352]
MPPVAFAVIVTVCPFVIAVALIVEAFLSSVVTTPATVTLAVAVRPLEVVAVIVAVPAETAVTTPFDTVATELSLDVQTTVLLVAFAGVTVAVSCAV